MADNTIQQIKDKLPVAEVIGGYVKLERAGRSLRARCPFHKERTPSFYVSPERGTYYCFGCGEKGDILTFVEKIDGLEFRDALKMLAERAGVPLTEYKGNAGPTRDEKERLIALHEAATKHFEEGLGQRPEVRDYLLSRGLTAETISKWRIGYSQPQWRSLTEVLRKAGYTDAEIVASGLAIRAQKGEETTVYDRFRGRIMFPISDVGGRVIAFSGRHFESMPGGKEDEPAKYVNSPETPLFRKSKVLYGLDRAKATMRRHDFAILVEGQFDLLMMHQSGFPSAVAASGTALTEEHLRAIAHLAKRLVLALDGDAAGQKSALRAAQLALAEGFDVRVAAFPEGKDPADVGRENIDALKSAIREAKTAVEYFIESARVRGKDERAVRRLAEAEVIPLIGAMHSAMDQAHFVQLTARALDLPEDSVKASLASVRVQKRDASTDEVALVADEPLSRLMHAAALVLVLPEEDSHAALRELLSQEQFLEAQTVAESNRERLLFSLERDGMSHTADELIAAVREELVGMRLETLRREIAQAEARGDTQAKEAFVEELLALSRKKHGT